MGKLVSGVDTWEWNLMMTLFLNCQSALICAEEIAFTCSSGIFCSSFTLLSGSVNLLDVTTAHSTSSISCSDNCGVLLMAHDEWKRDQLCCL